MGFRASGNPFIWRGVRKIVCACNLIPTTYADFRVTENPRIWYDLEKALSTHNKRLNIIYQSGEELAQLEIGTYLP